MAVRENVLPILATTPHLHVQIAREAEAAMFHRQMFEELRRTSHLTRDPTETVAIGTVEASFKCCASAIIVLTKTGRSESYHPFRVFHSKAPPPPHTPGSSGVSHF